LAWKAGRRDKRKQLREEEKNKSEKEILVRSKG
jgi:hypothetical protein